MPRSVITHVMDYEVHEDGLTLECPFERLERPINIEDLTIEGGSVESTFGVDHEGEPLGNVPFDEQRTVPIRLRFYEPAIFRFELRANAEAGQRPRYTELDDEAVTRSVDLDVVESDEELRVESDTLTVRIGLEEWSFAVEDRDGTALFEEQRGDVTAKGHVRAPPLGFDEEVTNRWPYRVDRAGMGFRLAPDEHIYGLGEKFTDFDKRGQRIESWVTQPNGCDTEDAYKNVPFYLSTRGYGLLVDTPERVEFDFGADATGSGRIAVDDDAFAFVFFYGPEFDSIVESYTAMTGRASLPPKWTFGVWLSRYGLKNRELVEDVVDRIREENLPWDGVKIDPYWLRRGHSSDLVWDTGAYPDPEEFLNAMDDRDIHVVLWEHPYLPVGTAAYETARDEGYLVNDRTGKPYLMDRLCESTQRGAIVDFTDPNAVNWWQEKHRPLLKMGVDGFWTDFGEYLPRDAVLSNGRSGKSMRNEYPGLYNEAVYDVTADVHGEENAFVWARSGWIGGQQLPMYWSGDPQATFEAMGSTLRGGLSFALSGFPFWSHNIGGFSGEPSTELYIRWAQFGLLSTQTIFHGTTPREPWEFGEQAVEIVRRFAELRYSLVPYLYSYAAVATETGLPVMRPLILEYQDDPAVRDDGTQYLLGESLLVAPIFESGNTASIYLPEGEWVDYWTDERYEGGQTLHRTDVPIDEVPLFVRSGSVIARRAPTESIERGTPDAVTLDVTLKSDGAATATGPFFDEDRGTLGEAKVTVDESRNRISATVPDESPAEFFDFVIQGLSTPPVDVVVDDVTLEAVDEEPGAGEWSYDDDQQTVIANAGAAPN